MPGGVIAEAAVRIRPDTRGFKRETESEVKRSFSGIGRITSGAFQAVVTGAKVAAVGMGILGGAVAVTGFRYNQMRQQAQIAFTTMLGSGKKATRFLDDLAKFAAATPFEFPELVTSSQRLLAMGFQAKKIIPTMTAIGDAVAGLGGSAETLGRVTTALGQIKAKGKASAEELLQLTESGIPAWKFLADTIGTSIPEAMAKVSKGAVDADTTIKAVVDGMNKRFGGMMEQQSHTFGGLLSTLKDTFSQVSGRVMEPFFELATRGMQRLADWTTTPAFDDFQRRAVTAMQTVIDTVSRIGGRLVSLVRTHWTTIATVVRTAMAGVGSVLRTLAALLRTDLGRQLALGAGALLVLRLGFSRIAPAVQGMLSSFKLVTASPIFAALAVLSLAIGNVAQQWISARIEAAGAQAAYQKFQDMIKGMSGSLLALQEAQAQASDAQIAVAAAARDVTDSWAKQDTLARQGKESTQEYALAHEAAQTALNNYTHALSNEQDASERLNAVQEKRKELLTGAAGPMETLRAKFAELTTEGRTVANQITGVVGVFDNLAHLDFGGVVTSAKQAWTGFRDLSPELEKVALKYGAVGVAALAQSRRLQESDPALARSARRIAEMSLVSQAFIRVHGRIPTKIEVAAIMRGHPEFARALDSIAAGAGKLPGKVKAHLEGIERVIADEAEPTRQQASVLGQVMIQGVASGLDAFGPTIFTTLSKWTVGAIAYTKGQIEAQSPSALAGREIGKPIAEGILQGFLLGFNELPARVSEKIRGLMETAQRAVQERQATLSAAWSRFGSDAMRAFDAATEAGLRRYDTRLDARLRGIEAKLQARVRAIDAALATRLGKIEGARAGETPAEKVLREAEAGIAKEERERRLTEARTATAEAEAGVGFKAEEGETPEEAAERQRRQQEAIVAAKRQLTEAEREIALEAIRQQAAAERAAADKRAEMQRTAAEKQAEMQRTAAEKQAETRKTHAVTEAERQKLEYQARRELQRRHLEDILTDLERSLQRHPEKWRTAQNRVLGVLDSYGVNFKTSGRLLGRSFANGLREAFDEITAAALGLAKKIAIVIELRSPARKGPLSRLDKWAEPFARTWLSGLDTNAIPAALGRMVTTPALPGLAAAGAAGTPVDRQLRMLQETDLAVLGELRRQTALLGDGRNISVYLGGRRLLDPNEIAWQARR